MCNEDRESWYSCDDDDDFIADDVTWPVVTAAQKFSREYLDGNGSSLRINHSLNHDHDLYLKVKDYDHYEVWLAV